MIKYKVSYKLKDALSVLCLSPEICFLFDGTDENSIIYTGEYKDYALQIKEKSHYLVEVLIASVRESKLIDSLMVCFNQRYKKQIDFLFQHPKNNLDKEYHLQILDHQHPEKSYKIINSILIFLIPYIMWEFEKQFSIKNNKKNFFKILFIYYLDYMANSNGAGKLIDINNYPINLNFNSFLQTKRFAKKNLNIKNEDIKHLISDISHWLLMCYPLGGGHWMHLFTEELVVANFEPIIYVITNTKNKFSSLRSRK